MKRVPPDTAEPDPPRRLRLTVTAAVGAALVPYLRRHLRAAHAILRPPLAELSLALVGDPAMSALHLRYMNLPGPTDVLTFPLEEDAWGQVVAGEVVVCVPEARRRAKSEGTDLEREALLYALHGMLHLCGFDDRTARQFARMHRAEDAILKQLGVGAVFRPGPAAVLPSRLKKPAAKLPAPTRLASVKRQSSAKGVAKRREVPASTSRSRSSASAARSGGTAK